MTTKERYWSRVRAGLCVRCGAVPPRPGMRMCFGCSVRETKYRAGKYVPSPRGQGAPAKYVWFVSSPEGEPCFRGSNAEAADFVGVTTNRIWQCAKDRKPCRGYVIERRLIDDGDED